MGKVNVVIVDATGNKEQKVGLPDDIKCGIIMVKLIEKIKLPSVGPDGNPISYKFIHKVTGRQLLETQTLGEAGIKDGDVLRLQPEITAGAACPKCGNTEPDENSFCSKCGAPISAQAESAQPSATVQNNATVQPYSTVQYQPGYMQAPTVVKSNIFDSIIAKGEAIGKYVGIISVVVYFIACIAFDFIDYDSDARTFLLVIQDLGYCGFLFTIVVYIASKLKKVK